MSIACMTRVWENSAADGSRLLLLLAIADHADNNGFAFPGIERLATMIRRSERQTRRLISDLEESGELLVMKRPGRFHLYIVLLGATSEHLAAAEIRAESMGTTIPDSILDRTLDIAMSRVTPDTAMSGVAGEPRTKTDPTPDILDRTPDIAMSVTPDIAVSADPLLTINKEPSEEPIWIQTLKTLECTMDPATFQQHLKGSRVVDGTNGRWRVLVRNRGSAEWLNGRLQGQVVDALRRHEPAAAKVVFECNQ